MTLSLSSISRIGNKAYPPPDNSETHDDLTFVFEQSDPIIDAEDENPDLKTEPIFFHHISVDSDPEIYQKTVEKVTNIIIHDFATSCKNGCATFFMILQLNEAITETAESLASSDPYISNTERFHSNSPFSFIPLIASLDYDNLNKCYTAYSKAASISQLKLTE
jgi:hypothetical protein